jgi:hypothetical protein
VLLANKLVPALGDSYLARTGYEAQQTDELADPNPPHNLWRPRPGDQGEHGDFGARAYARSPQLWATKHRGWLALSGVCVAGALIAALWRKGR